MNSSLIRLSCSLQPLSRFFHAAALLKDTMVIVGGRTGAEDYSNSVYLYQINCNTWIQPGNHSHLYPYKVMTFQGKREMLYVPRPVSVLLQMHYSRIGRKNRCWSKTIWCRQAKKSHDFPLIHDTFRVSKS